MATATVQQPTNLTRNGAEPTPPIATKPTLSQKLAGKFSLEPKAFLSAIKATIFNGKGSDEEMVAFCIVCDEYDLNPFTKEIYGFPNKSGGVTPVVSVDGWLKLINRQPNMDGMDFTDEVNEKGELLSVTCRIYRKDRNHPTEVTEYMAECKRNTEPWKQWPRRMLRHKATIQAARVAFGFSGIYDEDEAERISTVDALPSPPKRIVVSSLNERLATPAAPETNHDVHDAIDEPAPEHVNQDPGEVPVSQEDSDEFYCVKICEGLDKSNRREDRTQLEDMAFGEAGREWSPEQAERIRGKAEMAKKRERATTKDSGQKTMV